MGQHKKIDKKGHEEIWEWEETTETTEAIKKLHETIRQNKLKIQDDKFNYDTSSK